MALPAPVLQSIAVVSNNFVLSWKAWQGLVYQVQSTTDLGAPAWQNLGLPITATNGAVSLTEALPPDPHRFYRLMLRP
jgi:hypothetical protein